LQLISVSGSLYTFLSTKGYLVNITNKVGVATVPIYFANTGCSGSMVASAGNNNFVPGMVANGGNGGLMYIDPTATVQSGTFAYQSNTSTGTCAAATGNRTTWYVPQVNVVATTGVSLDYNTVYTVTFTVP
jgi:hypothetical protein